MNRDAPLVYSSHPEIFQKKSEASPEAPVGLPPKGQGMKLRREKQGRAGKIVTTIFEFQASDRERENLAKFLRKALGTGGTFKAGVIEIQGDQLQKCLLRLQELGYKPRQAGA